MIPSRDGLCHLLIEAPANADFQVSKEKAAGEGRFKKDMARSLHYSQSPKVLFFFFCVDAGRSATEGRVQV